jgi:hypothetical protein
MIRWHKGPKNKSHVPHWYAEVDGVTIANAHCTGRPGVDDYPWDLLIEFATEARSKTSGSRDTLRDCKDAVEHAWSRRCEEKKP